MRAFSPHGELPAAPSSSETFGLAVIEALAAGLPVVYTECPALEHVPDRGGVKARRVTGGPQELLRGMREALAVDRHREPPASIRGRPSISGCAAPTPTTGCMSRW